MFRLSHMTKCIGVVTMSALLLWTTSGIQVVSQQQAGPGPVRSQMLQHLANALAQLTASGGHILDIDEAAFSSLPDGTIAYIPLAKEDPAWQLLFDLVWKRKPVGPVPIGMLYVDHIWDGGSFKLKPGYYQLKVTNDLRLTAEDEETITIIGDVSFGGFTREELQRIVQSFSIGKQNPAWFVIVLGAALLFTGGCTFNVQSCPAGSVCIQQNQNNPPPPPPPPSGGGGGGGGGG